jgi:hypothetical protein
VETDIEAALSNRRRLVARWVWRALLAVVLVLVVWFILLPQFGQVEPALRSLGQVSAGLLLLGLVLELASITCYSLLTRATLNPRGRPGYFTLLRIDVATQGVNNAVPGGGPTSTALKFRLLTVARTDPANAVTGTTFEISTSVLALGLLFGLAMASVMPDVHGNLLYVVAGIVVIGVAILVIAAIILLEKSRAQTIAIVERIARRVPFLRAQTAVAFVGMLSDQVHHHRSSPRRLLIAALLALANWLLDIAALWVLLLAFGHAMDPRTLLVAYGLSCLVGLLPITPGGLGIIEGVLIPALVGFGTPHGIAILGVLTWRLVQYWLPLPLAAAAYLSLRTTKRWRTERDVPSRERVSV